jgi:hypothetical protein
MTHLLPPRIISGGQTGVDQAGLHAARNMGFETGGYAPKGYLTEIGPETDLLQEFGLKDSGLDYPGRTRMNVREADITLWFGNCGTRGYYATKYAASNLGKRFLVARAFSDEDLADIVSKCACVNIAGNRESMNCGIFERTKERMERILGLVKEKNNG